MADNSFRIKSGSLNLKPLATPPDNPVLGDVYVDAAGALNVYDGSVWSEPGGGGAGISSWTTEPAYVCSQNVDLLQTLSLLDDYGTSVPTGQPVLLNGQTDPAENGVYTITSFATPDSYQLTGSAAVSLNGTVYSLQTTQGNRLFYFNFPYPGSQNTGFETNSGNFSTSGSSGEAVVYVAADSLSAIWLDPSFQAWFLVKYSSPVDLSNDLTYNSSNMVTVVGSDYALSITEDANSDISTSSILTLVPGADSVFVRDPEFNESSEFVQYKELSAGPNIWRYTGISNPALGSSPISFAAKFARETLFFFNTPSADTYISRKIVLNGVFDLNGTFKDCQIYVVANSEITFSGDFYGCVFYFEKCSVESSLVTNFSGALEDCVVTISGTTSNIGLTINLNGPTKTGTRFFISPGSATHGLFISCGVTDCSVFGANTTVVVTNSAPSFIERLRVLQGASGNISLEKTGCTFSRCEFSASVISAPISTSYTFNDCILTTPYITNNALGSLTFSACTISAATIQANGTTPSLIFDNSCVVNCGGSLILSSTGTVRFGAGNFSINLLKATTRTVTVDSTFVEDVNIVIGTLEDAISFNASGGGASDASISIGRAIHSANTTHTMGGTSTISISANAGTGTINGIPSGATNIAITSSSKRWDGANVSSTIANNQAAAANVTSLLLNSAAYKAAEIRYFVDRKVTGTQNVESGVLYCVYRDTVTPTWILAQGTQAGESNIVFSITAGGQVQYTTDNLAGASYVGTMTWYIDAIG